MRSTAKKESEAPYISFVPSALISARNQGLALRWLRDYPQPYIPWAFFGVAETIFFMTCRIYNIVYKPNGILDGVLPKEIVIDLNKYSADVGFGNLNSKAYQAIKDVIGFEAEFCKVEMISRYVGTNHLT